MRRALAILAPPIAIAAAFIFACGRGEPALVISRVTVVDVAAGRAVADRDVVIAGSRIRAVGPSGRVRVPRGARVIDGAGRYLIPGLWDMHVHTVGRGSPDHYAALLLASGVTGVRDMGDDLAALRRLRASVAEGRVLAPRLVFGGRIEGPGPRPPFALAAETAAQGRAAVDSFRALGADFIKIPASLPRDAYFGIATHARIRNVPFAGHVPHSAAAWEAAETGQASIEHMDDLVLACTSREMELKHPIATAARSGERAVIAPVMRRVAASIRAAPDPRACAGLIADLVRHGTAVTPTLAVYQPYARGFDSTVTRGDRLRYVPGPVRASWRQRATERSPHDDQAVRAYFSLPLVLRMHRAGVRVMAGTDAPLPYVVPGFSLHDELALLVEAGLRPADALRAATLHPAAFLGAADSLGTVAPGRLADLVLLDADPLRDIRATRRIRAVVVNGRYLDRRALDGLLARAEAAAR